MKNCIQCQSIFKITDKDKVFYEKLNVTEPTLCPPCRQIRRLAYRNESNLYKRDCDLCKKKMISLHHSDKPFPVYCQECFWGDGWESEDFAQNIDWNRPFFEQWYELFKRTPHLSIINKQSQNSDYCNYSFANKNCYLCFGCHHEEDCLYGRYATENKNCMDYFWLYKSELSYECTYTKRCYRSIYLDRCEDSGNCYFSVDLKGCEHCIFSSNLRHKKYYILNKPHSKDEYFEKLKSYQLSLYSRFEEAKTFFKGGFRSSFPFRSIYQVNCENCEGTNHENSKNLRECFACTNCEDCAYGYQMDKTYNSIDNNCTGYDRCELLFETIGVNAGFNLRVSDSCWQSSNLWYCHLCFSSQDLFGCIGMKHKKYAILNKVYSKEEYEILFQKLKTHMQNTGEWSEFFPNWTSPFAYNETVAQEVFPLTKETALKKGYQWKEKDISQYKSSHFIFPEDINNVQNSVLQEILACKDCGKNYQIKSKELSFYKEMQIPLPQKCPTCRKKEREKDMIFYKLWDRKCDRCQKDIRTTFSPERPEKVYCEESYLKEFY